MRKDRISALVISRRAYQHMSCGQS